MCAQHSTFTISSNTTYNIQMFDVIWFQKNLPYRSRYTPCCKSLIITTSAFVAEPKIQETLKGPFHS